MSKGNSRLCTDQSAAHNGNAPAQLLRMQFGVYGHNDLFRTDSRNRRHQFICADGHNQGIWIVVPNIIWRYFCIRHNLDAAAPDPFLEYRRQFADILFKEGRSGRIQVSAQAPALLRQSYIVASLCQHDSRLHAGGTASSNQYPLLHICRRQLGADRNLQPHPGIYRTAKGFTLDRILKALITPQTGCDILFVPFQSLLDQIGIRQQSTAQLHHVGLS